MHQESFKQIVLIWQLKKLIKELQFSWLVCVSDRQGFQVGSLSHMINLKASGYQELPEFPEVAPDPSVRNVEVSSSNNSFYFKYLCGIKQI